MLRSLILGLIVLANVCSAQEKMNVLFIAADDMSTDLGTYGHLLVKTPNFDRLARMGIKFEHAYANYPVCNPSRASLMTGLYPDQTRVRFNSGNFRDEIPSVKTLPQMFQDAGYFTARVGKIYHYGVPVQIGEDGVDDPASWNEVVNPRGRDKIEEDQIYSINPSSRALGGTMSWMAQDGTDEEQTDGIGATAAIKLMADHKVQLPAEPLDDLDDIPHSAWVDRPHQLNLSDTKKREAMQAYWASISFVDAQLGRILDAVDELGLADNTIIVFWSDHGYHMGEHKLWQKTTLFENSARVPMMIASPKHRKTAGLPTESLAELVDLYPTLADLAGLPAPKHLVGTSLVPLLDDPTASVRETALTTFDTNDRVNRPPLRPRAVGYSIRTERWRYTEWGEDGKLGAELYDHWNDPKEYVNLALAPHAQAAVAEMKKLLDKHVALATKEPNL
jgi:iduronate 2-sulfatase